MLEHRSDVWADWQDAVSRKAKTQDKLEAVFNKKGMNDKKVKEYQDDITSV